MKATQKSDKHVLVKLYHGELQFSRLGDDAYKAVMGLLDAFQGGRVAGYERGRQDAEAKRYSYREVGGFPEKFLEEHLARATSKDTETRTMWLREARTLVTTFACRDQSQWFQKFRYLKAVHAAFHGYRAWLHLLSHLVKVADGKVVDWEMKLGGILNFGGGNGYKEEDPLELLSPQNPAARSFVLSFVESRSTRLTNRSEEFRKATEEEQKWHEEFTAELTENKDFFPFAVSRERFMDGPGQHRRASARAPGQDSYRKYQAVLREHQVFLDPASTPATVNVLWSQEVVVVKRPKVHSLNHVLLGQGLGMHMMGYDEVMYLKPFIKASRLWLGKSLVAFPTLTALTSAVLKAVVIPMCEWLDSHNRRMAYHPERQADTQVRSGRSPHGSSYSRSATVHPTHNQMRGVRNRRGRDREPAILKEQTSIMSGHVVECGRREHNLVGFLSYLHVAMDRTNLSNSLRLCHREFIGAVCPPSAHCQHRKMSTRGCRQRIGTARHDLCRNPTGSRSTTRVLNFLTATGTPLIESENDVGQCCGTRAVIRRDRDREPAVSAMLPTVERCQRVLSTEKRDSAAILVPRSDGFAVANAQCLQSSLPPKDVHMLLRQGGWLVLQFSCRFLTCSRLRTRRFSIAPN